VDATGVQLLVAFAAPGILVDPGTRAAALAVLDDDERARMARYVFERDRDLYLVMHSLERRLLSAVTGVAPERWRFAAGAHGRPDVAAPALAEPLSVNGSHTHGLTMCGVARGAVIGVDVEQLRNEVPLDVSDHYFAPAEQAAIRAAPPAEQPARFLTSWTLKESYMKARGLGMSLPLDQFAIELVPGAAPRLHVEPAWDDGIRWDFEIFRPTPHHIAAVCHNARHDAGHSAGDNARRDADPVPVTVLPDTWAVLNAIRDRPIL
jgi:4'-phosphopantetheinyl transferase